MQKQCRCPRGKTFHALLDECSARFERLWAADESMKAVSEAEKDARQPISSAETTVNPSVAHSAGGTSSSSSGPRSLASSSLTPRTAATVLKQAKPQHQCMLRQRRAIQRCGLSLKTYSGSPNHLDPGEEGSSLHLSAGSMRRPVLSEQREDKGET